MLKLYLLSMGDKMPKWVNQGFEEYAKRIKGKIQLTLKEIPLKKRHGRELTRLIQEEEKKIMQSLPRDTWLVVLDVKGTQWSTGQLAAKIQQWMTKGQSIVLAVAGPDGFSDAFLKQADEKWSLSRLTLPHPMVRILLAEQIYRALSIIEGRPYHRA